MAENNNNQQNQKFNWTRLVIIIIVIAALVLMVLWMAGVFSSSPNELTITELRDKLQNGGHINEWHTNIDTHYIYTSIDGTEYRTVVAPSMIGELDRMAGGVASMGGTTAPTTEPFSTLIANANLYKGGTEVATPGFPWASLIISLLPFFLIFGLFFFMRRGAAGRGGFGEALGGSSKSKARRINSKVRFSDVAGQEEVKEDVIEVVDFLKKPGKYRQAGARVPKGILLGGPPGTGKTLMAKAVAGESGVPFYFISASNFVEMFAGLGAKRVRDMFREARKSAPAILFIDELDAIGKKRGGSMSTNDEREQTLNQILVEMDGMDENSGLLVIAATNRPDDLDPALKRPGRFDRVITVNLPDIKEREAILKLHAKGKRIHNDIDFANIAKRTPGYSGADLESVINEATLLSVRESSGVITLTQIDEAIDRVKMGPAKKTRVITEKERTAVAVHEAGHAIVGLKLEDANVVQKITIIPRGHAGGYTLMIPEDQIYNYSKSMLLAQIAGYLGGRAAEIAKYGENGQSTGVSDDLQRATQIARAMVTQFGMSDLGPVAYEREAGPRYLSSGETAKMYSDAVAHRIDDAIRGIILEAQEIAVKIIEENMHTLDLIVEELLEKETIVIEEINYINENGKRPPKKEVKPEIKEKKKSLDELIAKAESKESNDDNDDAQVITFKPE